MKRFFWNVCVALLFWHKAGVPLHGAWQLARSADDAFNDGMTPEEAFESEVSYWNN